MFKFREDVPQSAIDDARNRLLALPAKIPVIRSYHVGRSAGVTEASWDMAVRAGFDDAAGYLEYASHPDHTPIVADIKEMSAQRASIQSEELG